MVIFPREWHADDKKIIGEGPLEDGFLQFTNAAS